MRALALCALGACAVVAAVRPADRAGAVAAAQRIHLSVRPDPAEANAVTPFRFVATRPVGGERRPVPQARVTFAGARAATDRRGRAVVIRRLPTGNYRARACKASLACGVTRVMVLPHGAAR
jgi:hypothetical protein